MNNSNRHTEFCQVIKTQMAEYRQNFLLNVGFIFSLAIATSSLLSILLLNHASKQEYQAANEQLTSPIAFNIVPRQGRRINVSDYAALRKLGFTKNDSEST